MGFTYPTVKTACSCIQFASTLLAKRPENRLFLRKKSPSHDNSYEFMDDLYIAVIYEPVAIFLPLTVWVHLHSLLYSQPWKSDIRSVVHYGSSRSSDWCQSRACNGPVGYAISYYMKSHSLQGHNQWQTVT